MAKKIEVEVEIDASGRVEFHVKGRKGKSCLEFLELFRETLGQVDSKTYTSEYHEKEEIDTVRRQRQKTRRDG